MKISDAIDALSKIFAEEGDLEILSICEEHGKNFLIRPDYVFEVIEQIEEGDGLKHCAFMPQINCGCHGAPEKKPKRKLQLVEPSGDEPPAA